MAWALSVHAASLCQDQCCWPALAADEGSQHQRHPFTRYLRRLSVQLDPAQYPGEAGRLVWDKALHDREHREALQLRRLGSRPVEAAITLELDHQPAQYRLSQALQAALGLRGLHSMPFVMQMLWGYIKAKQLYEVTDASVKLGVEWHVQR